MGGGKARPSGHLTSSWLLVEKVTCTVIFGNEHVNMGKEAGRQHFGFSRTIDTRELGGPY